MPTVPTALLATINQRSYRLALAASQDVRNQIERVPGGGDATVFDFAVKRRGTIAAGLELAKICMADFASVSITPADNADLPLPRVNVATDFPLLACMASQYAGWPLANEKFFAMCSGPARSLRGQEEILDELGCVHTSDVAVGVLETDNIPPEEILANFANECSVDVSQVMLCIARTASFPGTIQVVARSIETAMHKLHELKFDLSTVKNGFGSAPLPPLAGNDLTALGWTNDAILYGATVNLFVDTEDEAIQAVLEQVPSSSSPDFGTPFLDIFNRYQKDFYKIDKLLFSPAKVVFNNFRTGRVFKTGEVRNDILETSFGLNGK